MGPIHAPCGTGCAKIRKISISKTLIPVRMQEDAGENATDNVWSLNRQNPKAESIRKQHIGQEMGTTSGHLSGPD
jgi:hypothetical protein